MQTMMQPAALAAPESSSPAAGKAYRLGRIFAADGRTVILPVDHGTMLGRVQGLEDPVRLISAFLSAPCDGFLLGPGVAAQSVGMFARRSAPARLLTIDTYWRGQSRGAHVLTIGIGRAAALGVDGIKVLMPWDVPPEERASRAELIGRVISDAEPYGLPVMVEPIFLGAPRPRDAVAIEADGCRMAAELGADIIKVMYPNDPDVMADWCVELRVPVVILGGPAGGSAEELCEMVEQAIGAGARGIAIGRRVWQRPLEQAKVLLSRLAEIVHQEPVHQESES